MSEDIIKITIGLSPNAYESLIKAVREEKLENLSELIERFALKLELERK